MIIKPLFQVVVDSVNTRVSGSRDMDLRKWIEQDGFSTDFLLKCAEDADATTSSIVSDANESGERSSVTSSTPSDAHATAGQQMEISQEQPTTSTPLPQPAIDQDCVSGVLDEIRQVTITVDDLKAEMQAMNSKILLRELEHKDLKVSSNLFSTNYIHNFRNWCKPRKMIPLMISLWPPPSLHKLRKLKRLSK